VINDSPAETMPSPPEPAIPIIRSLCMVLPISEWMPDRSNHYVT
jgi:hypothetical protein